MVDVPTRAEHDALTARVTRSGPGKHWDPGEWWAARPAVNVRFLDNLRLAA